VLAATSRDLRAMMDTGEFRKDLFFRLDVTPIHMPRLADHADDIPMLAAHFWNKYAPGRPPLPAQILTELQTFRWNGNVRELSTLLKSLNAYCPTDPLRASSLTVTQRLRDGGRMDADGPSIADDASARRGECLRHLRSVEQTIRAVKAYLRAFTTRTIDDALVRRIRVSVAHRVAELQIFGQSPRPFHSLRVFDAVHTVGGGLLVFQSLLNDDPAAAHAYWRKPLAGEVTAALTAITREIERLVGER
jgi:DNA-binding NtrC family response regulator